MKAFLAALGGASFLLVGCGDDTAQGGGGSGGARGLLCDAEALQAALDTASSGDTVEIGACEITGSFSVPAGVTLAGQSIATSKLIAATASEAVVLTPGTEATRVTKLSIESDGKAGIVAEGSGAVELSSIEISTTRGIAIGAEGLDSFTLSDATLRGSVTPDNADTFADGLEPKDGPTHGLVLITVASAELASVSVTGFAEHGALFVDTEVTWDGGDVSDNRGTALMVSEGSATLSGLQLCRTLGGQLGREPFAAVFAYTDITSTGLVVCDNEDGRGIVQVEGTASHTSLSATGNAHTPLWIRDAASFELLGAPGAPVLVDDNDFAGLVLINSHTVHVEDASFTNTHTVTQPHGENGADVALGDGVEFVNSTDGAVYEIAFDNVTMSGNERVSLMIDLGPVDADAFFPDWGMQTTSVEAEPGGFGARAQGTPLGVVDIWPANDPENPSWDLNIFRDPATETTDEGIDQMNPIDFVGVGPPDLLPNPVGSVGDLTAW